MNYFSAMSTTNFFDSSVTTLAERLGQILNDRKRSCAVAESCTGGMIGAALTSIAGSSLWFRGGVIAYTNEVKMNVLNVAAETLQRYGAVHAETVKSMAFGATTVCGANCAVAVSGIAGPGGGTPEKPVGLVFIGCCVEGTAIAFKHHFSGDRSSVRVATTIAAIEHLIKTATM